MKYYFYFSVCKNKIYNYTFGKSIVKENTLKQVQNVSLEFFFHDQYSKSILLNIIFTFLFVKIKYTIILLENRL